MGKMGGGHGLPLASLLLFEAGRTPGTSCHFRFRERQLLRAKLEQWRHDLSFGVTDESNHHTKSPPVAILGNRWASVLQSSVFQGSCSGVQEREGELRVVTSLPWAEL